MFQTFESAVSMAIGSDISCRNERLFFFFFFGCTGLVGEDEEGRGVRESRATEEI